MTTQDKLTDSPDWHYDHTKRMYYKYYSECCSAKTDQKMLYKDKVIDRAKFASLASLDRKYKETTRVYRKWWQIWKPAFKVVVSERVGKSNKQSDVKFRDYCSGCNKMCDLKWEFKYE